MNWLQVPTEPPSRIYPIGTVIEDQKAIYQVMEPCVLQEKGMIHKYKCKVLTRKQPVPSVKLHTFTDVEWVLILKQTEHLIRLHG